MERRSLGRSGMRVTPIGVGLASLGRPGYINLGHAEDLGGNYAVAAMQAGTFAVLDAAWAAGVRYFDTARSYGRGEEFLGAWLRERQIDPAQVAVGSKWGYTYTANWQVQAAAHEVKAHTLDVLQRQWAETQQHLGAWLGLYQIHSATQESGVLSNHAVLNELAGLREHGIAIGLSVSGANQAAVIEEALAIAPDGVPLFAAVQATWNLLDPSAGAALHAAHAAGLGVIVKEAVANGRLTERNPTLPAALREQAARLNTSPDALAIAAVLAQPWVGVVLSGASSVAQLQANLAALAIAWDRQCAAALAELAEPPAEYWRTRSALPWN